MSSVARIAAGTGALVLALAWLGLALWWSGVRRLATFDRPAFTWSPRFRPTLLAVLTVLAAAALGLALAAHPVFAAVLSAAAAAAAALRARVRGPAPRVRRLRAAFAAFEREHADRGPAEVRFLFVQQERPHWGPDLAAQLAADCGNGADLAAWIVRMDDAVPARKAWAGAPRPPRDQRPKG